MIVKNTIGCFDVMYARGLVYVVLKCLLWDMYAMLIVCVFYYSSWTSNLVDPASSHTLVSKVKPCMSQLRSYRGTAANGSLQRL